MENTKTNPKEPISIDLGFKFWIIFISIFAVIVALMVMLWAYNSNRQFRKYITAVNAIESSSYTSELKTEILNYYKINQRLEALQTIKNPISADEARKNNETFNTLQSQQNGVGDQIESLKDRITQEAKDKGAAVNYASIIIYNGKNFCSLDIDRFYTSTSSDPTCIIGYPARNFGYSLQDALRALYEKKGLKDKEVYELTNEENDYSVTGIADLGILDIDSPEIENLYIDFSMNRN